MRKRYRSPAGMAHLVLGLLLMVASSARAADVKTVSTSEAGSRHAPLSAQALGGISGAGLGDQAASVTAQPTRIAVILWDEAGKRSLPRVADSAQWALTPGGVSIDMSTVR